MYYCRYHEQFLFTRAGFYVVNDLPNTEAAVVWYGSTSICPDVVCKTDILALNQKSSHTADKAGVTIAVIDRNKKPLILEYITLPIVQPDQTIYTSKLHYSKDFRYTRPEYLLKNLYLSKSPEFVSWLEYWQKQLKPSHVLGSYGYKPFCF
jgi:hypothetical protein